MRYSYRGATRKWSEVELWKLPISISWFPKGKVVQLATPRPGPDR